MMEWICNVSMMNPRVFGSEMIAGPDDAGRRLDRVLRVVLKDNTLSEIYTALRKGVIRVNGAKSVPERRLDEGDRILLPASLFIPVRDSIPNTAQGDLGQIADILILATSDLLFVNKPRGELSQGPGGLEGRIRRALSNRMAASLSFSPGPLHRLDRNTTGIITFPRSASGARGFTAMLRQRKVVKRYLALVDGAVSTPEVWRDRIGRDNQTMISDVTENGDEALSEMRPLLSFCGRSLILINLHSGLTHQIRVQASSRGRPLSGDTKYGGRPFEGGYILHALSLEFPEPPFPDTPRIVTAPFPIGAYNRLETVFGEEALRSAFELVVEAKGR